MTEWVRAAGGVVWRMEGELEVLLVHRPRRDDWSFPKGKVDACDLDDAHTALREVLEETGLRCALGRELPSIAYLDHRRRDKRVRYWDMRVLEGDFVVNDEVDEVRWLPVAAAADLLSYDHDRDVLAAFCAYAGAPLAADGAAAIPAGEGAA